MSMNDRSMSMTYHSTSQSLENEGMHLLCIHIQICVRIYMYMNI
jgi:hypothetical protein